MRSDEGVPWGRQLVHVSYAFWMDLTASSVVLKVFSRTKSLTLPLRAFFLRFLIRVDLARDDGMSWDFRRLDSWSVGENIADDRAFFSRAVTDEEEVLVSPDCRS